MKPAASTDSQPKGARESRARHVRAKAKDSAERPEAALELPGVQGTARSEGSMRNRRDPPRQPDVGARPQPIRQCRKGRGAERESEGLVVPMKACSTTRWRKGALLWSSERRR